MLYYTKHLHKFLILNLELYEFNTSYITEKSSSDYMCNQNTQNKKNNMEKQSRIFNIFFYINIYNRHNFQYILSHEYTKSIQIDVHDPIIFPENEKL